MLLFIFFLIKLLEIGSKVQDAMNNHTIIYADESRKNNESSITGIYTMYLIIKINEKKKIKNL